MAAISLLLQPPATSTAAAAAAASTSSTKAHPGSASGVHDPRHKGASSGPAAASTSASAATAPCHAPAAAASPLRLMQVHVLFRHGDRSPIPLESPSSEEASKWESRLQPRPSPDVLPLRQHTRGLEYPFGQLTVRGAQQAHNLGTILQQRYSDALGLHTPPSKETHTNTEEHQSRQHSNTEEHQDKQDSSSSSSSSSGVSVPSFAPQLLVRSTNFPRTYQSAFFVLKGLLGSEAAAAHVPIGIRSDKEENLYENDHCARGAMLWGRAWRERTSARKDSDGALKDFGWRGQFPDFKKAMQSFMNLPKDGKFPWMLVIDNASCMHFYNDPLPGVITPNMINALRDHSARDYGQVFSIREIARLAMGPLLWEIHEQMDHCRKYFTTAQRHSRTTQQQTSVKESSPSYAVAGVGGGSRAFSTGAAASADVAPEGLSSTVPTPPPRLLLYSGHDATIMPLAAALGIAPESWPPYSSWMALELWSTHDSSQYFVRVIYNGQEVPLPTTVPPSHASASWTDPGPWQRYPAYLDGSEPPLTNPELTRAWASNSLTLCSWDHFFHLLDWAKMPPNEYHDACKGPHSNL